MSIRIAISVPGPETIGPAFIAAACQVLNAGLARAVPAVEDGFRSAVADAVRSSPEYASLLGGKLQAELGPAWPLRTVEAVIQALQAAVKAETVVCRPTGAYSLEGGMRVSLYRPELSSSLGDLGRFRSEGGYLIDWLDWLLNSGDRVVVADYHFVEGKGGRNRLGVMKKGGGWGVPPEFAGTPADNWLSRAVSRVEGVAEAVFESALKTVF